MKDKLLVNESHLLKINTSNILNEPFPHYLIDDFFKKEVAEKLESEFPDFNSDIWHIYKNPIEVKKTCNNWNQFPNLTYKVFTFLNSRNCNLARPFRNCQKPPCYSSMFSNPIIYRQ